jgi:hypothetical protein
MGIINGVRKVVGGTMGAVGKFITPPKKPVIPDHYHTNESADDYQKRLLKSRTSNRY